MASAASQTTEDVARRSYGKLLAFLAARTRDVAAAEDALADAFAAALADWPKSGVPENPEAWLLTTAKRRFINKARHARVEERSADHVRLLAEEMSAVSESGIPDQRLALMFACAHPAIDPSVRTPLILQTVLGLDAARIASAFLVSPTTMGQRLVRAKAKIRDAGIAFAIPARSELAQRLDAVLTAIYAAFSEGWSDPAGADAVRRDLASEAIYLGQLVCELLPGEAEALGLVALMLFAESRRAARRGTDGTFIHLDDQNPSLWDAAMIEKAEWFLRNASALNVIGRYQLEAALQSAHVERRRSGRNNWPAVLQLYDALLALSESPVVALNRALALAEIGGPEAALRAIDALDYARLKSYQPYWAARASLLTKTGAHGEAREAYQMAIGLERDPAVRRFLQEKASLLPQ